MEKMFNWISLVTGVVGGVFTAAMGGIDKFLVALAIFVVIDYLTGIIKATYQKKLSSEIGFKGIAKKIFIFLAIGVAVTLEGLIGGAIPLREITICFYLANEGISLLENMSEFIPMPGKLKDVLLQIRGNQESDGGKSYE